MYVTRDTGKDNAGDEVIEAHAMPDHHIQMHPIRHCKVVHSCQVLSICELHLRYPHLIVRMLNFIERLKAA